MDGRVGKRKGSAKVTEDTEGKRSEPSVVDGHRNNSAGQILPLFGRPLL